MMFEAASGMFLLGWMLIHPVFFRNKIFQYSVQKQILNRKCFILLSL